MAMEIFWASGSPYSWRVMLGAVIRGIDFESRLLDFSKGDLKKPEFLALNPRGRVPVIRDESFVLYESLAILDYFDTRPSTSAAGSSARLLGAGAHERARIRRVISEFDGYAREPIIKTVRALLSSVGGAPPGPRPVSRDELDEASKQVQRELDNFERLLSDHAWLASDQPSAADAAVFPFVRFVLRASTRAEAMARELRLFPLEASYPHLWSWIQRVEALPGYDATYPPHWRTA